MKKQDIIIEDSKKRNKTILKINRIHTQDIKIHNTNIIENMLNISANTFISKNNNKDSFIIIKNRESRKGEVLFLVLLLEYFLYTYF